MDFEAIKAAARSYGPDMTRFLRDMIAFQNDATVGHLANRHDMPTMATIDSIFYV